MLLNLFLGVAVGTLLVSTTSDEASESDRVIGGAVVSASLGLLVHRLSAR